MVKLSAMSKLFFNMEVSCFHSLLMVAVLPYSRYESVMQESIMILIHRCVSNALITKVVHTCSNKNNAKVVGTCGLIQSMTKDLCKQ